MVYSHYLHLLPYEHLQVFEFYLLWLLYCIYPLYPNLLHCLLPNHKHQYQMCKIHKILPIHDFLVNVLLLQHLKAICQPKIKIKNNTKNKDKKQKKKPVTRKAPQAKAKYTKYTKYIKYIKYILDFLFCYST